VQLTRQQLRRLIIEELKLLNEIKIAGFEVAFNRSMPQNKIKIGGRTYELTALGGWVPVKIKSIIMGDDGLPVIEGEAKGKTKSLPLKPEAINNIAKSVKDVSIKEFEIAGDLLDVTFTETGV